MQRSVDIFKNLVNGLCNHLTANVFGNISTYPVSSNQSESPISCSKKWSTQIIEIGTVGGRTDNIATGSTSLGQKQRFKLKNKARIPILRDRNRHTEDDYYFSGAITQVEMKFDFDIHTIIRQFFNEERQMTLDGMQSFSTIDLQTKADLRRMKFDRLAELKNEVRKLREKRKGHSLLDRLELIGRSKELRKLKNS